MASENSNAENLKFVNILNMKSRGDNGFMEIDSHNPGDGRRYRVVDHNGSRNLSDLMTCAETHIFIAGMVAMATIKADV